MRLHFEVSDTGIVTSPQAPDGNLRDLAESEYVAADDVIAAEALRLMLAELIADGRLQDGVPESFTRQSASAGLDLSMSSQRLESESIVERDARAFQLPSQPIPAMQQRQIPSTQTAFRPQEVVLGPLVASWLGVGELVLVRRVRVGETSFRQGVWLDWPSLDAWLTEQVDDVMPTARLVPTRSDVRSLTTIPVSLEEDASGSTWDELRSPLGVVLVMTWLAALLATIAIGVVLRIATNLAERRGRFVSAVTHELRTPMTSLRLYADLLASDSAHDEDRRARFVSMLRDESARLAHIVENVLVYARLGRSNEGGTSRRVTVAETIERVLQDQQAALKRTGLDARVRVSGGDAGRTIDVDSEVVVRILGNLIENACKYATPRERDEVEIRIDMSGQVARITVRDWGPGIPPRERRRIFESFHRAERDEMRADGLGLGLALARGLARQEGGDLSLDDVRPGASFTVSLSLVAES